MSGAMAQERGKARRADDHSLATGTLPNVEAIQPRTLRATTLGAVHLRGGARSGYGSSCTAVGVVKTLLRH